MAEPAHSGRSKELHFIAPGTSREEQKNGHQGEDVGNEPQVGLKIEGGDNRGKGNIQVEEIHHEHDGHEGDTATRGKKATDSDDRQVEFEATLSTLLERIAKTEAEITEFQSTWDSSNIQFLTFLTSSRKVWTNDISFLCPSALYIFPAHTARPIPSLVSVSFPQH